MLVTHQLSIPLEEYLDFISVCLKSGVTCVQLRGKNAKIADLMELGKRLKTLCQSFNVPLIINDNLDLCLILDANGLHLGQDDGDVYMARQKLGPQKILGLSVNALNHITIANTLPLDYIGVGAIFPTQTKDVQTIWGLAGLNQAVNVSRHPVIAIGGIDESNAQGVMEAGAYGIAAIGAFHNTTTPEKTIRSLLSAC